MNLQTGDQITISECTIGGGGTVDAFVLGNGTSDGPSVRIMDCNLGVGATSSTTTYWFNVRKGNLFASRVRFGGEAGGKKILSNGANGNTIEVVDCDVYSTGNNYEFGALPARTRIKNNIGSGAGLYLGAIPASQIISIGNTAAFEYEGECGPSENGIFNTQPGIVVAGVDDYTAKQVIFGSYLTRVGRPQLADLQLVVPAVPTNFGYVGSPSTNVNGITGQNIFGAPTYGAIATSSTSDTQFTAAYTTALASLPSGTYTAVFDLTVGVYPLTAELNCADGYRKFRLETGRHMLCAPVNIGSQTDLPPLWWTG